MGIVFYFTVIRVDASYEALQRRLNEIAQFPESADATVIVGNALFFVAVAETRDEQLRGLSNIKNLPPNTGMLFPQEQAARYIFWMKDMKIPIDFIWMADNQVVHLNKSVQPPPPLALIVPDVGAAMVLELAAGSIAANGIATSSPVIITYNEQTD